MQKVNNIYCSELYISNKPSDYLKVIACSLLVSIFVYVDYPQLQWMSAHVYFDDITDFNIIGGACRLAVDQYPLCIAGLVGYCPALYDP